MIPAHAPQMAAEATVQQPAPTTNGVRLLRWGSAATTTHEDDRHDDNDDGDRNRLRRISCADRGAFEQLYHDYYNRLARFLTRVTRNKDDLEEVINDAMLVVWQHAGEFRGASRVSTWIFGIAYRCALKSIRRSRLWSRATELEFEDADAMVADSAGQTEDRQLLDIALARLPRGTAIASGVKVILIDLGAVMYLTSAAFRALLVANRDLAAKSGRLGLCGVTGKERKRTETRPLRCLRLE
jgi:RNA polymerase sigma-70 factor (ECF subfamily)